MRISGGGNLLNALNTVAFRNIKNNFRTIEYCSIFSFLHENKYSKVSKFSHAFTLAEVLITLGIIGVVAAMTISTLQAKIQEKRYTTQYKKIFSELNQAMRLLQNDESLPSTLCNKYDDSCFRDKLATKLKVSHVCESFAPNKCRASSDFLDKKSHPSLPDLDTTAVSLVTLSGYTVTFYMRDCSTGVCGFVVIDTNGKNKPNVIGKDEFYLIAADNHFIPVYKGEDKLTACYKGSGISCSAVRINGGGVQIGGSKNCDCTSSDYDIEYCCERGGCGCSAGES